MMLQSKAILGRGTTVLLLLYEWPERPWKIAMLPLWETTPIYPHHHHKWMCHKRNWCDGLGECYDTDGWRWNMRWAICLLVCIQLCSGCSCRERIAMVKYLTTNATLTDDGDIVSLDAKGFNYQSYQYPVRSFRISDNDIYHWCFVINNCFKKNILYCSFYRLLQQTWMQNRIAHEIASAGQMN